MLEGATDIRSQQSRNGTLRHYLEHAKIRENYLVVPDKMPIAGQPRFVFLFYNQNALTYSCNMLEYIVTISVNMD
ncbi:hypothetical protein AUC69_12475 [Methyloceanibacter superfactus]|uniref:Uncharacterized protein n=1 Tax=Methyloceanibacter superfactus TaxID=1774969 RepID=A0A1E3VV84_9HYPH|nr:hypothetical protein AUC69_12475 [Methyloceanibacter superfactus]